MSVEYLTEAEAINADFKLPDGSEIPPVDVLSKLQTTGYNNDKGSIDDCPDCHGKGLVMYTVYYPDRGHWGTLIKKCHCYNRRESKKVIRRNGIENLVRRCTFDNYKAVEPWQKKIKETAMNYDSGWFFIGGQSGAGKTFICIAILNKMLEKGYSIQYMPWGNVTRELKSYVNDPDFSYLIQKYLDADVLYIDDFFKTRFSGGNPEPDGVSNADVKIAFEILNYRYINNLRTIISSEFILDEISYIDSALGGRIFEMCDPQRQWINVGRDNSKNWRLKRRR